MASGAGHKNRAERSQAARRAGQVLGVRARVALLLLAAVVPLLMLAVVIVWQNYNAAAAVPLERVRLLRAAVAGRYATILDDAAHFLAGVAALPEVAGGDPAACATVIDRARALRRDRLVSLSVIDAAGQIRCGAPSEPATRPIVSAAWFDALRAGAAATSAPAHAPGADGAAMVLVAVRRSAVDGSFAGAVVGGLLLADRGDGFWRERIAAGSQAWLIDRNDRIIPLSAAPPIALPSAETLRRLLDGEETMLTGRSRGGGVAAYAVARLDGSLRLLVGTDAAAETAAARAALMRRLAGLALLLGAGLAGVALGAHLALVAPIKRLAASVQAWRAGAAFDPGPSAGAPLEIRHLAESFTAAAQAIAGREQQVRLAVDQQTMLLREIHHRVKNNLQIIASLLNLQASRIRLPDAKREFTAARDRVRALATLHRHLYAYGDVQTINMGRFLHELCDQLLAAMEGTAVARIRLRIEAPEVQISSDQAVPMALIVTEAVSNAAKYAFPDGRSGLIRVALMTEGVHARLLIEDDGVGLPPRPTDTGSGQREGLGIQLIEGFARQLGGRLSVTRDGGTRYELALTLRRNGAGAAAAPLSAAPD